MPYTEGVKEEPSRRLVRVAQVIQAELGRMAGKERQLETALITFTAVDLTPDLKQAFVYWSSMAEDEPEEQLNALLHKLAIGWQRELGKRLHIKYTPRLTFRHDDGQQRGDRVIEILRGIDEITPTPESLEPTE